MALDGLDTAASQRARGCKRRADKDARLEEFGVENAPADNGGPQGADYGFDLG
jgi:hypothetical protein